LGPAVRTKPYGQWGNRQWRKGDIGRKTEAARVQCDSSLLVGGSFLSCGLPGGHSSMWEVQAGQGELAKLTLPSFHTSADSTCTGLHCGQKQLFGFGFGF
jgi:hypothetical protein